MPGLNLNFFCLGYFELAFAYFLALLTAKAFWAGCEAYAGGGLLRSSVDPEVSLMAAYSVGACLLVEVCFTRGISCEFVVL